MILINICVYVILKITYFKIIHDINCKSMHPFIEYFNINHDLNEGTI